MSAMDAVKRRLVDGLEVACRATRLVEWIPGWHRIYPQCLFARWSSHLDHRWGTGRWPVHDEDGDDAVWASLENLSQDQLDRGHWHHW
jgi:hypothetical protein